MKYPKTSLAIRYCDNPGEDGGEVLELVGAVEEEVVRDLHQVRERELDLFGLNQQIFSHAIF